MQDQNCCLTHAVLAGIRLEQPPSSLSKDPQTKTETRRHKRNLLRRSNGPHLGALLRRSCDGKARGTVFEGWFCGRSRAG